MNIAFIILVIVLISSILTNYNANKENETLQLENVRLKLQLAMYEEARYLVNKYYRKPKINKTNTNQ